MKKTITFLLVLSECLALNGCASYYSTESKITGDTYADADKYSVGDFTYNSADVDTIEINWLQGKITLIESDSSSLTADESGEKLSEEEQMHYLLDGRTLRIRFCESGVSFDIDDKEKYLTLEIPKGIELSIVSTSADIYADTLEQKNIQTVSVSGCVDFGIIIADSIKLSSTSGKQTFGSVTAKEAEMCSVSGDLTGGQTSVDGEVSCSTTSGKVNFERLEVASADINTVSGNIDVGVLRCPDISINTTSGNAALTLPEETGASLEYHSTSGDLLTDLEYTVKNGLKVFRDGEYRITMETVSGDLKLN